MMYEWTDGCIYGLLYFQSNFLEGLLLWTLQPVFFCSLQEQEINSLLYYSGRHVFSCKNDSRSTKVCQYVNQSVHPSVTNQNPKTASSQSFHLTNIQHANHTITHNTHNHHTQNHKKSNTISPQNITHTIIHTTSPHNITHTHTHTIIHTPSPHNITHTP